MGLQSEKWTENSALLKCGSLSPNMILGYQTPFPIDMMTCNHKFYETVTICNIFTTNISGFKANLIYGLENTVMTPCENPTQ